MSDINDKNQSADIQDIKRMIQHRYPFLFIDAVREIKLNELSIGIKNVTFNEPHVQGHFPERPVMPGVTIVEAMAQTAAVLVLFDAVFANLSAICLSAGSEAELPALSDLVA